MGFEEDGKEAKATGRQTAPKAGRQKPADLIASRLKTFYEGVTEEGTPDHLLTLLDKLDAAEKAANAQKDGNS